MATLFNVAVASPFLINWGWWWCYFLVVFWYLYIFNNVLVLDLILTPHQYCSRVLETFHCILCLPWDYLERQW